MIPCKRKQLGGIAALLMLVCCGGGPVKFRGKKTLKIVGGQHAAAPHNRRVEVVDGKINIREKIYFDSGKAVIKQESYDVLNEVAQVMKDSPDIKRVRVDGHASLERDTPTARALNKRLSSRRAQAVASYLQRQGVAADRLESKGYGAEVPLESNDTAEGREKNRRVEFTIVEQDSP
ncbi:MAG TPA: OmpA family protein [Sorangium sp.]|nr:OmpA family protein [Sorangium sp.]